MLSAKIHLKNSFLTSDHEKNPQFRIFNWKVTKVFLTLNTASDIRSTGLRTALTASKIAHLHSHTVKSIILAMMSEVLYI